MPTDSASSAYNIEAQERRSPYSDSEAVSKPADPGAAPKKLTKIDLSPDRLTRSQKVRRALLRILSLGETDYLRIRGEFVAVEQNFEGELTSLGEAVKTFLKVAFLPIWAAIHTFRFTKGLFDRISILRTAFMYVFIAAAVFGAINFQTIYAQLSYIIHKPSGQILAVAGANQAPPDNPKTAPTQDMRILIPKIGVNAPIVLSDSRDPNLIHDDLENGIVHYPGTALPGELGNVFLTGHSSNYSWAPGKYNYVFTLLGKMSTGDLIAIYYQGHEYDYSITRTEIVAPTDIAVLNPSPNRELSLMTCWPVYTSQKRLIVIAQQISPKDTSFDSSSSGSHLPSSN
jgi:LPXTG-site transpeptidase (sortase) family protein